MRRRCPNQRRWCCHRRDDAVGSLISSRMLRLLLSPLAAVLLPEHTQEVCLWQRMSNTSKRQRSAMVVDHASEPYSKSTIKYITTEIDSA